MDVLGGPVPGGRCSDPGAGGDSPWMRPHLLILGARVVVMVLPASPASLPRAHRRDSYRGHWPLLVHVGRKVLPRRRQQRTVPELNPGVTGHLRRAQRCERNVSFNGSLVARRGRPCRPFHRLLKKAGDAGSAPCTVSHQQRWVQPWFILLRAQDGAWSGCCSRERTAAGPQDPTVTHDVLGPCGRPSSGLGLCPCLQGSVPRVLPVRLPRGHQSGATDREWTRQSAVPVRGWRRRAASRKQSSACSAGALGRQRHAASLRRLLGLLAPSPLLLRINGRVTFCARTEAVQGVLGREGARIYVPGTRVPPSEGPL